MSYSIKSFLMVGLSVLISGCGAVVPSQEKLDRKVSVEVVKLSNSTWSKVQTAVKNNLKDPASAKFGPYTAFNADDDGAKFLIVCGYVNAKNGFGGYGGMTPYIAMSNQPNIFDVMGPGKYYGVVCANRYGIKIE
jgi:hypothetical protein